MTTTKLNEAAQAEYDLLRAKHGELLLPATIVDFARDESTALHSYFEWDDSVAAEKWRLAQARRVIQMNVIVVVPNTPAVRAEVSLTTDRVNGGGYRRITDVMADEVLRSQLLQDALAEFRHFRRKYELLCELKTLFEAADQIELDLVRQTQPPLEDRPAA